MDETLSFEEVKTWLRAAVGDPVSVHLAHAHAPGTIAFLDGSIDKVMGFENSYSHGLLVEGAAGAWTLDLAEPEFVSATLSTIPDSHTVKHFTIKMRNHWVQIDPGLAPGRQDTA